MTTSHTISELIELALAGDPDARRKLVQLCRPRIEQGAQKALGPLRSREDRAEVVQRAYIALLEALPRFRGDSSLLTFAWRIAYIQGQQFLSGESRLTYVDPDDPMSPVSSEPDERPRPDQTARDREYYRLLCARLCEHLSTREQLCMQYLFVDELEVPEVARLLNVTADQVYNMVFKIRTLARKLRREMDGDDG